MIGLACGAPGILRVAGEQHRAEELQDCGQGWFGFRYGLDLLEVVLENLSERGRER